MVSIHTTAYHDIIELLRKARDRKKLSQRALARLFGVSQSYISKIETCELRLDVIDYFRFAALLDISDEEILKIVRKHIRKKDGRLLPINNQNPADE